MLKKNIYLYLNIICFAGILLHGRIYNVLLGDLPYITRTQLDDFKSDPDLQKEALEDALASAKSYSSKAANLKDNDLQRIQYFKKADYYNTKALMLSMPLDILKQYVENVNTDADVQKESKKLFVKIPQQRDELRKNAEEAIKAAEKRSLLIKGKKTYELRSLQDSKFLEEAALEEFEKTTGLSRAQVVGMRIEPPSNPVDRIQQLQFEIGSIDFDLGREKANIYQMLTNKIKDLDSVAAQLENTISDLAVKYAQPYEDKADPKIKAQVQEIEQLNPAKKIMEATTTEETKASTPEEAPNEEDAEEQDGEEDDDVQPQEEEKHAPTEKGAEEVST